jgi:hypothetical protein
MADRSPKSGTALIPSFDGALQPQRAYAPQPQVAQQYVQQQTPQLAPDYDHAQPQYAQQQPYAQQQQYAQQQYAHEQQPYAQQQCAHEQQQYAQQQPYAQQQYAEPQYAAQPQYGQHQLARQHRPLECPECGRMTNSLKQYKYMSYLAFVWFFAFWNVKHALACPSCMRNDLLIKLTYNAVLANILWPFIILPWNVALFVMTFGEGHSKGAEAALQQGYE